MWKFDLDGAGEPIILFRYYVTTFFFLNPCPSIYFLFLELFLNCFTTFPLFFLLQQPP